MDVQVIEAGTDGHHLCDAGRDQRDDGDEQHKLANPWVHQIAQHIIVLGGLLIVSPLPSAQPFL